MAKNLFRICKTGKTRGTHEKTDGYWDDSVWGGRSSVCLGCFNLSLGCFGADTHLAMTRGGAERHAAQQKWRVPVFSKYVFLRTLIHVGRPCIVNYPDIGTYSFAR